MESKHTRAVSVLLSLALILTLGVPALADQPITVPAGTIIPLHMDTYLSSDTARVGERFTATVSRNVVIDRRVIIPSGAKIEGRVTGVDRAERGSKAGTIAIGFDRLIYPNGQSMPIDGTLTTLNDEARRSIEAVDEEDRVQGGSRTRRAVVFIGGGAGVGAVIGAVTGGAKGAAVGAGIGAVLGTIGVLLTKGEKAEVKPGTEFGLMVERPFTIETETVGVAGVRYPYDGDDQYPPINTGSINTDTNSQTILTSPEAIRAAQTVLRDRGFYNGPINGAINPATRDAIRQFQRDRGLSVTGDLDISTARALGIHAGPGSDPQPTFDSPDAIRAAQRILRDRGFYNGALDGNLNPATRTAIRQFQRDRGLSITGDLDLSTARALGIADQGGPVGGGQTGSGIGNARQIAFLADRLFTSYSREMNLRTGRGGQVIFDSRRDLKQSEVELLFHLNSLKAASDLYNQMATTVTNQDALKGAADSLVRQARLVNRVMKRGGGVMSSIVASDWQAFQTELSRISLTNADLDNDPDRIR